jgi:DNA-binding CsgD family transcriptional regulator
VQCKVHEELERLGTESVEHRGHDVSSRPNDALVARASARARGMHNADVADGPLPIEAVDSLGRCRQRLAEAAARFRAGEFRSSVDAALEAGELAKQAGRPDLLAEAALVQAGVPDPATAPAVERLCRDALGLVAGDDLPLRARLHGQLAVALHHRDRFAEADAEVGRALSFAELAGDPLAMAAALNARQLAMAGLGHGPELLELGARMLDAAAASGSTEVELQARNWRIDALFRMADTAGAAHEIDSLEVLATRTGTAHLRWNARLAQAGLAHAVGRLEDAERLARESRDMMPPDQRPQTEPVFIAQLMLIATDRGVEPPEIRIARGFAIGAHPIAVVMMGRYDLEIGDIERARAAYEAARHRLPSVEMNRRGIPALTAGVELAVAFRDVAVVADLHRRILPFDGTMIASALGAVGPTAHFLARAEGLLGDHDRAVVHARAAVDMAARGDFGPWLARSRLALAEALMLREAAGDREEALRVATLAAVNARELGMGPVLARTLTLVDRLNSRHQLSKREREIAGLVAGGASNRDMARSLGLSERTIETHVQNVLTKLGFHSRSQIAAWAIGEGIPPASIGTE